MDIALPTLKDLDTFTLLVKNCPKNNDAHSETLLDFVKRLTWQENVEIEKVGSSDYSVKFINVPTDAEEVIDLLRSETYLETRLDVVQVKKVKKLYLCNLKPDAQRMEICLYLEQSKFLPLKASEDYRVEVLHIDRIKNYAIVKLPDEADISLYVNVKHSDTLGKGLRISEYSKIRTSREDRKNSSGGRRGATTVKRVQGFCKSGRVDGRETTSKSLSVRCLQQPPSKFDSNRTTSLKDTFKEWIEVNEVDREKCQLMKKLLVDLRKSLGKGWEIWLDDKLHRIGIGHCDDAKLQDVIIAVQGKLACMTSTFLQLPCEFALAIKSSRGYSFIIKLLDSKQLRAVYYFDSRKNRGMVLGENREAARMAAEVLIGEFFQCVSERTLVTGDKSTDQEWQRFSSSIMRDHLVHVSLVMADYGVGMPHIKKVMLQGFKSDPDFGKARMKVDQKLVEMCSSSALANQNVSDDEKLQSIERPPSSGMASRYPSQSTHERKRAASASTGISSNVQTESTGPEAKNSVKMSPLVFKFFKTHLSNFVSKSWSKYMMPEQNLVIRGREEEIYSITSVVQSILATIVEKQATIKINGMTEEFFNEKNGELKSEILKFELDHTFAINFKTDKDGNAILNYAFQNKNQMAATFPELIKGLLVKLSKRKSIPCSEMFADVGAPRGIVTERLKDSITKVNHEYVKVKYDNQADAILLVGREKFFGEVENPLAANQRKVDTSPRLRTSNLPDLLNSIGREEIFVPDHWVTFTGNLRRVSSHKGQIVLLDPNSTTYKYVNEMVLSTWTSGQLGFGRDAACLNHSDIKVVNIYSVENVFQYKRYMTRLKEFCLQNSGSEFSRLDSSLDVPVLTRGAADRHGLRHLLWEANEYHLFHGTKLDSKQAIVDQGLDFRLGSKYALFGQGIYFAENSTKSDQYADPKENRSGPGDSLFMFVARVFMGRMHHATRPEPYKRPPCTDPQCSSDKCSIHPLNDSVIGTHTTTHSLTHYNYLTTRLKVLQDGGPSSPSSIPNSKELEKIKEQLNSVRPLLFREFVIYDPSQCFPEFLIEYKRL